MLQNFLNQFRERNSTRSDEHLSDLERAITRLREMVGIDQPREMTAAYLGELRAAVEAVVWAIKDEQWAREGYSEFLGGSAFGGVPAAPGQQNAWARSGSHRDLEPVRLLKAMSIARSKAGCARFLTLIHSRHRPER